MSEMAMPRTRHLEPEPQKRGATRRCVEALVDVLIDECRPALPADDRNLVKQYVSATLTGMPDYFQLGFRILALVFDFAALPVHGHRFTRLAPTERCRHVAAWRGSRIGFRRAMIAFYTTFACYGLYSLPGAQNAASPERIAA